jgi:hypothetical protein
MQKIYNLNDITDEQIGCWIDGTNMSGADFDIQIVETAIHFGYAINIDDWREIKSQIIDSNYDEDVLEDTAYVSDDAMTYLELNVPEGYYFEIDANCLFLTHEDLELINE